MRNISYLVINDYIKFEVQENTINLLANMNEESIIGRTGSQIIEKLEREKEKLIQENDRLSERVQKLEQTNAALREQIRNKPKTRKKYTHRTNNEDQVEIEEMPLSALQDWWYNLSEDWQKSFNKAVLSRGETLQIPTKEQLRSIFERKKIEIVGSGILIYGLNQLSFKLNDISGLKDLKQLTELNLSGHDLKNLDGIQQFQKLELLNCTSNRISTLRYIKQLKNIKTLVVRANNLSTLTGIGQLKKVEYVDALYNRKLYSIAGIEDLPNLKTLSIPSYKTKIIQQLEQLKAVNPNLEVRNA